MCADTTTSLMRRTQDSVTHVPGQPVTHVPRLYSLLSATFVTLAVEGMPRTPIRGENPRTNATRKDVNRESGNH